MSVSPVSHAHDFLTQGQYADAAIAYKQAIASNPDDPNLYWNYGIALLLNGQEEEAQSVWMSVLLSAESAEMQVELTRDLAQVLGETASHHYNQKDFKTAWILCRYQCEFAPSDAIAARQAVRVGLQSELLSLDDAILEHLNVLAAESNLLFSADEITETGRLLQLLYDIDPAAPSVQALTAICIDQVKDTPQATAIAELFQRISSEYRKKSLYLPALIKSAVELAPNNVVVLSEAVAALIATQGDRHLGIELAKRLVELSTTAVGRLGATTNLIASLMRNGGQNQDVQEIYAKYKAELTAIAKVMEPLASLDSEPDLDILQPYIAKLGNLGDLVSAGFPCFYFEDQPEAFRHIRNPVARAAQVHTQVHYVSTTKRFHASHHTPERTVINRPLRIGYIANTFRRHSVGWLCRWLLKYHNRDRVDVHLYTSKTPAHDFVQEALIRDYGDRFHVVPTYFNAIAEQIFNDDIDILVELDGMTDATTMHVMALKPAPIQVSWLGFDASGLPAIDYFIADPYVLPDNASSYYCEQIWRLPQTYVAVDGFEVYTPTIRRHDLDIPTDAIVYFSSQLGLKRNPHNVKLQLQILKAVPNSYLLIKSLAADPDLLRSFFVELAEEVGVSGDRLRFLSDFPTEFTYRANLQLADVVLDTYPYNGATTTLEALWMGLPIVTRVGEQFAARNSYTMMVNAGITEGIAWSDEEYVEWGTRFGHDEDLRRDVVWNLQRSRHSAPLWNAKQFTREMERAYEHMWRIYSES